MTESPAGDTRVRGYSPADIDACRSLWVELTEWHRTIYGSPSIGGEHPGGRFDEHLAHVGPANIWVAERDGAVVGMAGLIAHDEESELEPLVVTAVLRGRGIGRMLTEAVMLHAVEAGYQTLSVRPVARNAEAVRFFHAAGFTVLGHLELMADLRTKPHVWRHGETVGDRDFLV